MNAAFLKKSKILLYRYQPFGCLFRQADTIKTNSIVSFYKFNKNPNISFAKSYTLANDKKLLDKKKVKENVNYGTLGQDNHTFYLEAYSAFENNKLKNYMRINANIKFSDNLKMKKSNGESKYESVALKVGNETIEQNDIINAIKENWEGEYKGTKYDFYKGMDVEVSVNINVVKSKNVDNNDKKIRDDERYISGTQYENNVDNLNYATFNLIEYDPENESKTCARPITHMSELNSSPIVYLYVVKNDTNIINADESDADENNTGENSTANDNSNLDDNSNSNNNIVDSNNKPQSKKQICKDAAHEFGHVLGLMDAYNTDLNYYVEPVPFDNNIVNELNFNTASGEMMYNNGLISSNDIEMIIYAKKNGKRQSFVPIINLKDTGKYDLPSTAIKAKYIYYVYSPPAGKENTGLKLSEGYYYFGGKSKGYKVLDDTTKVSSFTNLDDINDLNTKEYQMYEDYLKKYRPVTVPTQ